MGEKRLGRDTSKLCLNWGPITTAHTASYTNQCWFSGCEEERVENRSIKVWETFIGWEVKGYFANFIL